MFGRSFITSALVTLIVLSCAPRPGKTDYTSLSVEEQLEVMRTDTAWINTLDSLAEVHLGPEARCLDAVKHTFSWDDRLWIYNQDWGGVLEIPEGFVPEDDCWQAELSYHGAPIFSPDSVVYINHFEGYQSLPYDDFRTLVLSDFEKDSLIVSYSLREEIVRFKGGEESPVLIVECLNVDRIKGYFRYIYSGPESIEYSISIQYPSEDEEMYGNIRRMIDRYPFGPDGQTPSRMN